MSRAKPKKTQAPPAHVLGYCRYSPGERAETSTPLESQAERIRAYCTMRQLVLTEIVNDTLITAGKPLSERPGGARVVEAIEASEVSGVVAVKLDRVFRSTTDCLSTVERWDEIGVAFHLVDLGGTSVDTRTATGRMFLTMLAGFAEFERQLISERTTQALAYRRSQGLKTGGDPPYGWKREAAESTKLVPNDEEQAVLALVRELREKGGLTLRGIGAELARRGVRGRNGQIPGAQTVANMLRGQEITSPPQRSC